MLKLKIDKYDSVLQIKERLFGEKKIAQNFYCVGGRLKKKLLGFA